MSIMIISAMSIMANIIVTVLIMRMWRQTTTESHDLIEKAYHHISARSSMEAANSINAQEEAKKIIENYSLPFDEKKTQNQNTVIKDSLTGKEYDVIGGWDLLDALTKEKLNADT